MLRDGGQTGNDGEFIAEETPSRYELLSMVRKHSHLLGKTTVDEQDAADVEMDTRFWHEMLDLYFIHGRESMEHHDDDLLFFVRNMSLHGYGFNDNMEEGPPYFVRRWAPKVKRKKHKKIASATDLLDKVVGENSADVDWRRSFYLNLIAHTTFSVTVAICRAVVLGGKHKSILSMPVARLWVLDIAHSSQALEKYQKGADTPLCPVYKGNWFQVGKHLFGHLVSSFYKLGAEVKKTVYASPSRVDFQLDFRKEVETIPAYPNICFAVDDFDATFDAVVLTETDHCYCVLLNAHDGAAFRAESAPDDCSSSKITSLRNDTDSGRANTSKLTLFSGFVSYQMVREAYDAGKSRFGSLLSISHFPPKADRLYMKGPGGRGEVEVAVSGISDQSQQISGPPSPLQLSKRGFGISIGTIVRKAASAATVAAKHAYAAASTTRKSDAEMLPLKCCLMSITLPWECIAHDLLFKGSSLEL